MKYINTWYQNSPFPTYYVMVFDYSGPVSKNISNDPLLYNVSAVVIYRGEEDEMIIFDHSKRLAFSPIEVENDGKRLNRVTIDKLFKENIRWAE